MLRDDEKRIATQNRPGSQQQPHSDVAPVSKEEEEEEKIRARSCVPRDDTATSSTDATRRRAVSFGSIAIRQYSVTLGDHPCCSYGFPVQLDWNYREMGALPVEDYERGRGPVRRSPRQMVLSSYDRRDLLREAGHSLTEMQQAQRNVNIAKRQRAASLVASPAWQVTEALQGAVKKIFTKRRRRVQL